ncbi:hypothetical protein KY321_04000 [Candidatus Woesearchaeota archaeon]|nr:hypothetical protein [Candidatus Woesearchaeota archaeon]
MKENKLLKSVGGFIATNKVSILYIGGSVLAVAIAIPLYKRIKNLLNFEVEKARTFDYIEDIPVNTSNATITPNQAKIFSNQLVDAMSVSSGTDESAIKSVFEKIKNKDDMNLLYKTFGVRKYSTINTGEASGVFGGVIENTFGYIEYDLAGWLKTELGLFDWRTKRVVNEKLGLIGISI